MTDMVSNKNERGIFSHVVPSVASVVTAEVGVFRVVSYELPVSTASLCFRAGVELGRCYWLKAAIGDYLSALPSLTVGLVSCLRMLLR